MGTLRVLIVLLFTIYGSYAIGQEGPRILWRAQDRLEWDDFKGNPPPPSPIAAITASGISYEYKARPIGDRYELDYNVGTYFYPSKSWYRPDKCNDFTLAHEQLHFDISELFARKMRKLLHGRSFGKNVKSEIRKMFRQINTEMTAFQDRYDQETDYSRNREMQIHWNQFIRDLLGSGELP